jgi:uncharacterized phage-associated protein
VLKVKLNIEKMKQLIHYIIYKYQNKPNFGKTVLYKLMYFSDFNHYEIYEKLITGETYIKKANGPVPQNFGLAYNQLKNEGKVNCEKVRVHDFDRHAYSSPKSPNLSLLKKEEVEVIDDVIERLSHMKAKTISDYSHEDRPWRVAGYHEVLNPEFVFYRSDEYSVREYE